MADKVDWADPGYFSGSSRIGNSIRVLVQLIRPPRGHRTLPTRTGMVLILVTIGVGTAAFNTGQNILYLALAMLLSTLLVSGLLSWFNFKGCRWKLDCGRHFRAGQASPVHVDIENMKKRLPSYSLAFLLETGEPGQKEVLALHERLDPRSSTRLTWEYQPVLRGRQTIRLKGLVSRYPFGFLRKSITDSFEREVLVWPGRVAYELTADRAGRRWMYGQHRKKGEGVELIHLRDYSSGDPLRKIHWKATARAGKLQVRETEQEHHRAFSLLVDPHPGVWKDAEQFERMCSFAGSLAEDLFQRDQLRSVQFVDDKRIQVGSIEDLYTILDALALVERKQPEGQRHGSTGRTRITDCLSFLPGPDGSVLARLEEVNVGQA